MNFRPWNLYIDEGLDSIVIGSTMGSTNFIEVPMASPSPSSGSGSKSKKGQSELRDIFNKLNELIRKFNKHKHKHKHKATGEGGGGGWPGEVTGGGGTSYSVDVYFDGLSAAATNVTVTQLQIASGENIPVGTWAIVVKAGDAYYMQVPVWL